MIFNHSLCFALGIAFVATPIYAQVPGVDAQPHAVPSDKPGGQGPTASLKDPIELCGKLAGVEREICARQAQENRERASDAAIGATPGSGGTVTGGAASGKKSDTRR